MTPQDTTATSTTPQDTTAAFLIKLQKQRGILEQIPDRSKAGFSLIADQMGHFSVGFAAGVTQAVSIRERLATETSELGIKPLRDDYRHINQEINAVFQDVGKLIEEENTLKGQLQQITSWAMNLEQDIFLPSIVDQLKGQVGQELERKTLGSIIDSLVGQMRALVQEIMISTQDAANTINNLSRRVSTDLEASKHNFSTLKARSVALMEQMVSRVKAMDTCCAGMEDHAAQANGVIFEMAQDIQYDDISAQRFDHTVQNLKMVEQRLAQGSWEERDKRWVTVATSIVAKHLEDISSDLSSSVQSLRSHLERLETIARERALSVTEARDTSLLLQQEIQDLFYHLNALLRLSVFENDFSSDLLRNFSKTENSIFQAKRAFDTLHLTTQRLDKLLPTLDFKSSHRLEILTKTIGQLVDRIQHEGARRGRHLVEITNQLQDINLSYSESTTPKIMRATTLLRRVPLRAQQVESDHNDVLKIITDTIGATQAIVVQAKLLSADMTFHRRIQKGTEHITAHIETLLEEMVGPEALDSLQANLLSVANEFEDLSNLYTMASERISHGEILGEEPTEEEIFGDDDIELF